MPSAEHHEQRWEGIPEGLEPERFAMRLDFLLARVDLERPVLDLGSGEGRFALELRARGAQVTAADVAEEPLRRLARHDPALPTARVEPGGELPFADGAFGTVWAGEVVEHVADPQGWLSEVRRVLAPAGRLLLSTPDHPRRRMLALALRPRALDAHFDPRSDHLRFFTRRTLAELVEDLRFEILELRSKRGTLLLDARRMRF